MTSNAAQEPICSNPTVKIDAIDTKIVNVNCTREAILALRPQELSRNTSVEMVQIPTMPLSTKHLPLHGLRQLQMAWRVLSHLVTLAANIIYSV